MQQAATERIGTSVVNHEAKRAIANSSLWMDEIEGEIVPLLGNDLKRGVTKLQQIIQCVRAANEDAFEGCKMVIVQQKLASGVYVRNDDSFQLKSFIQRRYGCRPNVHIQVSGDVPKYVLLDVNVFQGIIRNVIHNAECHGGNGKIEVKLTMENTHNLPKTIVLQVTNSPGSFS